MTTQDTIEKYVEKLVDRGWETNEGGYFPHQFTCDQIDMVRTTLHAVAEEARKEERKEIIHHWFFTK
jgi:hypothetical protein